MIDVTNEGKAADDSEEISVLCFVRVEAEFQGQVVHGEWFGGTAVYVYVDGKEVDTYNDSRIVDEDSLSRSFVELLREWEAALSAGDAV